MHSLKSALRLHPLGPRSRATIHTLNLQARRPPPAPAPGQRRDTPDRLCRRPRPALLPCLSPFLFSPRRTECLLFLRLDPLAFHPGPWEACSGLWLLSLHHLRGLPSFCQKQTKSTPPHLSCHPGRDTSAGSHFLPCWQGLSHFLYVSPHGMRAVSPDCRMAPAFLNVPPTSSTTLSLSKVTGGFPAVIPQPTALSVCSFNTVVLPP